MARRFAEFFRTGWLNRATVTLALAYPLGLLATILAFRFIGERWWVTAVGLYLPRVVFLAPLPVLIAALLLLRQRKRLVWGALAACVPLGLAVMGFVLPWPVHIDHGAPSVRILSYNVASCEKGPQYLVEEIDRFAPDIVFLQEVGPLPGDISKLLQAHYPTIRSTSQFIVATKFPISSSHDPENVPFHGRLRSPRWVQQVIETPLGPIAFYNVHPISPREGFIALIGNGFKREVLSGRLFTGANKDRLQVNGALRALQVADVATAAREETLPVVIAGDTNLPGMSFVLNEKLGMFQDGFARAGWGFGYTFPTTRRPWMRIDRMFASRELRFVHFEVGRSRASDHHCIVADLQRAP